MRKCKKHYAVALATASVMGGFHSTAKALTSFTAGDLVVLQGGDATNTQTLDTGTVPAYLDEYNTAGTLIGQVAVPTTASGSNYALTLNNAGSTSHEGVLTLSENGQYLSFVGYNTGAGTGAALSAGSGTIGVVGNTTSSLSTATLIANGGNNMRAAATIDGNEFYVAEAHGTSAGGPGGLNYVSGTGASATNTVLGGVLDPRSLVILGGSNTATGALVAGSGSSSFAGYGGSGHGVYGMQNGSGGLPNTSSTLTGAWINSDASDGSDEVFDNEPNNSNSYHGYNTMYLSGNTSATTGFVEKYSYNGTVFVEDGSTVLTTSVSDQDPIGPVSYTHLTLPTKRIV